ncbi:MAG: hypothetical protein AAB916_02865 [Patescibacteria group bacterium]
MQSEFAQKLYEKRLELYPRLLNLTQDVGKETMWRKGVGEVQLTGDDTFQIAREALEGLIELHKDTVIELVLSDGSFKRFENLKKALRSNRSQGKKYGREQMDNFWKLREELREWLRKDVGIYHESAEKLESK